MGVEMAFGMASTIGGREMKRPGIGKWDRKEVVVANEQTPQEIGEETTLPAFVVRCGDGNDDFVDGDPDRRLGERDDRRPRQQKRGGADCKASSGQKKAGRCQERGTAGHFGGTPNSLFYLGLRG